MNRLRRGISCVATALSAILFLAVAMLWPWSYRANPRVEYHSNETAKDYLLLCQSGRVGCVEDWPSSVRAGWDFENLQPEPEGWGMGSGNVGWQFLGFQFQRQDVG